MEIKINTYIPHQNHLKRVEVFGYTSRSQPGLEILGINGKGRTIKEKFTFLSKKRKLKFNLVKFLMCVEGDGLEKADLEYLELPLLIGFWTMAGALPIGRLDNCLCSGKVSLEGDISLLNFPTETMEFWNQSLVKRGQLALWLGGEGESPYSQIHKVNIHSLLNESIGGFRLVS